MRLEEKQKAIRLRKKGYSLKEISLILQVSKSTISLWLRGLSLNNQAILRLKHKTDTARAKAIETNKNRRENLKFQIAEKNKIILHKLPPNDSLKKVICALLYWCEGSKNKSFVGFTNSDPEMMKLFVNSLRSAYDLDERKFRVLVHIHEYHNETKQKIFWSRVTGINLKQFQKSYIKPHTGKNKRNGYPGCACLKYYDYKIALDLSNIYELIYKNMGAW